MMKDIKLIAIDLDGTLLDRQQRLSFENRYALESVLNRGVLIALATARDCASIMLKVPINLPGLYLIGSGGALIYEVVSSSLVWAKYLNADLTREGVHCLRNYNHPVFLNAMNDYWVDRYNERVQMVEERYNLTTQPFQEPGEVQQPIMRVSLSAPPVILEQAAREASLLFGHRLSVSLASPDWLDLLAPGAGKGRALAEMQAIFDVKPAQTMAIGDYDSDLTLFEQARHRVAMDNAVPAVKNAATFITASNDDNGVARVLEMIDLK
jgi:Cof subfamily protein (haloacid dehalogenase superfamily)